MVSHYPPSPYGYPPVNTAKIYDAIFEAGSSGATYQQIADKTGIPVQKIGTTVTNLCGKGVCNRRVMVYRLPVFDRIRLCFAVEVPRELAEQAAQKAAEPYLALSESRRKARNARAQRDYMAGKRSDPEYLKAQAEREAKRVEKEAIRQKAKKDAADRKALEAQQRAQRLALRKTMKAEAAMNNHLARKVRGTTRGIVQVEETPAPTIVWPESVQVQRAPRPLGRWEVASVTPLFSALPPGQYLSEAA